MALTEKLTAIADAIRDKTGGTEGMTPAQMPEQIARVHEAGRQAEYDAFWDAFQDYGNRTVYRYAFMNGFTNANFYPKYDLKPGQYSEAMFWSCNVTDLTKRLEECGVSLDTSLIPDMSNLFGGSYTRNIPAISTISANSLRSVFSMCVVEKIDKLILRTDGSQTFDGTFYACGNLINLTIEGVIGNNGFNTAWSKSLSKASIVSIINALSDTTSNLTVTLSRTSVDRAFETTPSSADGSASDAWKNLVASKSNWTISLL